MDTMLIFTFSKFLHQSLFSFFALLIVGAMSACVMIISFEL